MNICKVMWEAAGSTLVTLVHLSAFNFIFKISNKDLSKYNFPDNRNRNW